MLKHEATKLPLISDTPHIEDQKNLTWQLISSLFGSEN
jgi:hypothetical protein